MDLRELLESRRDYICHALNNEIVCDETEDGPVFETCSDEEAADFILENFDEMVYQFLQANSTANVLEAILRKHTDLTENEILYYFMVEMAADVLNIDSEESTDEEAIDDEMPKDPGEAFSQFLGAYLEDDDSGPDGDLDNIIKFPEK